MAHTLFSVEVLTPEGEVFNGEVEMLSTRTNTGSIGVRANHAPLLAIVDPTELRLYIDDNEIERFAQGEGYLQVVENAALVLVDEAKRPEDLDRADLESRVEEARNSRDEADEGSEERSRHERDIRRYEAFLELADSE